MMKTKGMVAAALLMLGLSVSMAAAQNGLLLRYKYTAGAVDAYVLKGTLAGAMSAPGQGTPMPLNGTVDGGYTIKTTSVSDQGVAAQETTLGRMQVSMDLMGLSTLIIIENGQASVTVNGQPMELPKDLPGMSAFGAPIKTKVDARGRVLKVDLSALGDLGSGFDPSVIQEINILFPEAAVSPGQTWSNLIKLPLKIKDQALELRISYTYTLVGIEQYQGRDVARINFKGDGGIASKPGGAFDRMKQTFAGYELFDNDAGRPVYDKVKLDQTMSGPAAPNQPQMSGNMTADFEITAGK